MLNSLTFPKYFSIQTTSLCNASCVFCPYKDIKDLFPRKIMDMTLYKKIIDECGNYRDIERIILYMNNEPLTDPYLIERINYAKERLPRTSVHILTNGLLLTEETAEGLINSGLDWIGISFQGIRKETVEKAMGIPFEIALGRISNFIDKAKEKKNIEEYVMLTFLKHKYLDKEEKKEAVNFWKNKGIKRISYFDGSVSRAGNTQDLPKVYHRGKIVGCNSIWADEMIHIVEDGKVLLCCMDWRREIILGDLNNESVYEAWNGGRRQIWATISGKKTMPDKFLCRKCEEAKLELAEEGPSKSRLFNEEPAAIGDGESKEGEELILVMTPPWQTKMVPLGVAYLSSFLKSRGVKVKVIDLNVKLFNECASDKKYFWEIGTINSFTVSQLTKKFTQTFYRELEDFIEEICNSQAKFIGFSTTIASSGIAVYLAHQIKLRKSAKITILGGSGCYWNTFKIDPEKLIDIFVVGEGEFSLLKIIEKFKETKSLSGILGIQGTVVCLDKQYFSFLPSSHIKKIDELSFPQFREFNLEDYNKGSMYKPLPLLISRGCINNCSFCIDHKISYPFRARDPYKVVEEIKFHLERYGRNDFEFNDLLCNGDLRQLEKICDLIIEANLDIKWTSYAVIRRGMSLELFKKMRKAGCRYICYGMESASDAVLKKMNKKYNARLAEEVIRNTHNASIDTAINIIIGHPAESEKEFRKTCKFIERNKDFIFQVTNVSTCFLMLETDLMNNLDKYGVYFKPSLKAYFNTLLGKKISCPNHRKFYAYSGNTPRARARWMRRFLKLLHKVDIHYVIINYVKEQDKNLNKFIERLGTNTDIVKYKHFKLDASQKGQCKIWFKNMELTADVGMNTSFCVNGKWIDSSSAKWKVKSSGSRLDINLKWIDFSVTQHWRVKFTGRRIIDWEVKTYFNGEVDVDESKMGIIVSDKYSKYAFERSERDFPNLFTKNWEQILFLPLTEIALTADMFLPGIVLRGESRKAVFSQLQNSPSPLYARMFNMCYLMNNDRLGHSNKGQKFGKGDILEGKLRIYLKS